MPTREEVILNFGARTSDVERALHGMRGRVADFGKSVSTTLIGAFAAPVAIGGLIAGLNKIASFADGLKRTADALDISTDFLQDFQAAARQSGSSDETAQKGLEKLSVLVGKAREEGGEAAEAFNRFGISLTNANGTARSTEEIVRAVSDKMRDTSDGATRAAMAVEFFGKAGVELIATLQGGSAALDEFGKNLSKLSEEDIAQLDATKDAIDELGKSALIAGGRIVGGLLTSLDKLRTGKYDTRGLIDLAQRISQSASNPWSAIDNAIDWGTPMHEDAIPFDKKAGRSESKAAKLARVKRMAEEFAEAKKFQDARIKAEQELTDKAESTGDKANRLQAEISSLERLTRFQLEGIQNDKTRAELAKKRIDLQKTEAELSKQQLDREKGLAAAKAGLKAAGLNYVEQQRERNGLTIAELADMPIQGGYWAGRGRQKRWVPENDAYAGQKRLAQGIEGAKTDAEDAKLRGDIDSYRAFIAEADMLTGQLDKNLVKPSEFGQMQKSLDELVAQWAKFMATAIGGEGGGIKTDPANGK